MQKLFTFFLVTIDLELPCFSTLFLPWLQVCSENLSYDIDWSETGNSASSWTLFLYFVHQAYLNSALVLANGGLRFFDWQTSCCYHPRHTLLFLVVNIPPMLGQAYARVITCCVSTCLWFLTSWPCKKLQLVKIFKFVRIRSHLSEHVMAAIDAWTLPCLVCKCGQYQFVCWPETARWHQNKATKPSNEKQCWPPRDFILWNWVKQGCRVRKQQRNNQWFKESHIGRFKGENLLNMLTTCFCNLNWFHFNLCFLVVPCLSLRIKL